jgi:hypothetical protein
LVNKIRRTDAANRAFGLRVFRTFCLLHLLIESFALGVFFRQGLKPH